MSGLNTKKLLMLMKYQTAMMQYLMFGVNITLIKFLTQNALNIKTVFLLMIIES